MLGILANAGIALLVVTMPLTGQVVPSGETTRVATSASWPVLENRQAARSQAIEEALRSAVRQAFGVRVSSETELRNSMVVYDKVIGQSVGAYVQRYTIVSESEKAGMLTISVEADVSSAAMNRDLAAAGLLLARKRYPRITVEVENQDASLESSRPKEVSGGQLRAAVEKEFQARGVPVRRSSLSGMDAAEVVVRVEMRLGEDVLMPGGMHSRSGGISAVAEELGNRRVLGSVSHQMSSAGVSETMAMQRVVQALGEEAAKRLVKELFATWEGDLFEGTTTEVSIVGVDASAKYTHLMQGLRDVLGGGTEIIQRSFDGVNGRATISLRSSLTAPMLADLLRSGPSRAIGITNVSHTANRLVFQVSN